MDGGDWMVISIIAAIGIFIAGMIIGHSIYSKKDLSGFIIVDKYDPDGPYMFLELGEDVEDLCEREVAMLGIIVRDPQD